MALEVCFGQDNNAFPCLLAQQSYQVQDTFLICEICSLKKKITKLIRKITNQGAGTFNLKESNWAIFWGLFQDQYDKQECTFWGFFDLLLLCGKKERKLFVSCIIVLYFCIIFESMGKRKSVVIECELSAWCYATHFMFFIYFILILFVLWSKGAYGG